MMYIDLYILLARKQNGEKTVKKLSKFSKKRWSVQNDKNVIFIAKKVNNLAIANNTVSRNIIL